MPGYYYQTKDFKLHCVLYAQQCIEMEINQKPLPRTGSTYNERLMHAHISQQANTTKRRSSVTTSAARPTAGEHICLDLTYNAREYLFRAFIPQDRWHRGSIDPWSINHTVLSMTRMLYATRI